MKRLDRIGALTGAAYVILVIVGNAMSTDSSVPQSPHPTGQQDLATLRWLDGNAWAQVGLSLELLGFAAFVLFVGYLCTRVRSAGWLASSALLAGGISIAVKLASAAPSFAAYLLREEISPATARVLTDMNTVSFVLDWLPTGLFVACVAAAAVRTESLGRVLGWGGVVVGTATIALTAVTGVHVINANPVPFLMCLLWTLIVSVRMGFQRTVVAMDVHAPTPIAAGT
jgi:hypothetical protein